MFYFVCPATTNEPTCTHDLPCLSPGQHQAGVSVCVALSTGDVDSDQTAPELQTFEGTQTSSSRSHLSLGTTSLQVYK